MAIEMTLRRTYYDRAARREYRAGDVITVADEREAERLERRHRATRAAAANPTDIAPQPKAEPKAETKSADAPADATDDEITRLRAEYTDRFGKRPFMGWSPEQLRERMALEAEPTEEEPSTGSRYSRRDLRAKE